MTGKARTRIEGEWFRRKVRELLALGYSVSRIAKELGATYAHTKTVVSQEQSA